MKKIAALLACAALTGCASLPSNCAREAALAGALGAGGGYALASGLSKTYTDPCGYVNENGDCTYVKHNYGTLHDNRAAIAVGTGLIAGAVTAYACARK